MTEFPPSSLASSLLFPAVKSSSAPTYCCCIAAVLLRPLLPIWSPLGNTGALTAQRRFVLLPQCIPHFVLLPAQKPPARFFSVYVIHSWTTEGGRLVSSQAAPSAAIAVCQMPLGSHLCFPAFLLVLQEGRHRDLKTQARRGIRRLIQQQCNFQSS